MLYRHTRPHTLLLALVFIFCLDASIIDADAAAFSPLHQPRKLTTKNSEQFQLLHHGYTTLKASVSDDGEEKRLRMLTARREAIRSTLKNANSFKKFRSSTGLVSKVDEETGEVIKSDGKVTLTLTAFVLAASIAILRIGGRAALMSLVGIDFANDNPELKASVDAFLDYTYQLDPSVEGLIFVIAWTFAKVFCFDVGGIVLALSAGVLFDGVFRGAVYSSFAATIGSSVAYYIAKLDTPIRKRVLILMKQYPSLRGIERVVAEDGVKAILTLRVAPIIPVPIGAYNYLYGVSNVYYWDFAVGIFLGSLKPYLLDSYLGYYGKEVFDGAAGYGTEEDLILLFALAVSALVGIFATQLAADTWSAVKEEIEIESMRKGDRDSDGVIKKVLGLPLPSWAVENQRSLKETEREIERMIKSEYKAGIYSLQEGESSAKLDPSKYPGSPEILGAGSGYDTATSLYNGFVLNPSLVKAFFKYSDPLYDLSNDVSRRKLYQFDRVSSDSASDGNQIQRDLAAGASGIITGKYGMKDEVFFVLQVGLLFSIFDGNVPLIGDTLAFLLGPGCVLLGGSLIAVGTLEMGTNLSPWVNPPENGQLVTSGVFQQLRHPMSAGMLYLVLGISTLSNDAMRLTLSAMLFYVVDVVTSKEEEAMVEKFGEEYDEYKARVQSKFIPERIVKALPLSRWYLALPPL
mmetsp:Transcript_705/g.1100  ORF Transcript_705/g.1100 Transcript_705/m.1100 type:complete len:689 (-) Transcript_705:46-2112(-)